LVYFHVVDGFRFLLILWGCEGGFFASKNGFGWCPFYFGPPHPVRKCREPFLLRWVVYMWFLTSMGSWWRNELSGLICDCRPIRCLHSCLDWKIFKQVVWFNLEFIFGLLHNVITSTNTWTKLEKKNFFLGSFESSWTKVLPEKWSFSCYLSQKASFP
jgi:hypothetical protein